MKDELINKRWKIALCNQGRKCWCRKIQTEDTIDDSLEITVVRSGDINKGLAEHIVEIHNNWIRVSRGCYHDVEEFYKE